MKKIGEWLRNLGKLIDDVMNRNRPEPVPVRVPVRR